MRKAQLEVVAGLLVAIPFLAGWLTARATFGYDVTHESAILLLMLIVFWGNIVNYEEG